MRSHPISSEMEMALSYWACSDWTCENQHLNSINLFSLHSDVKIGTHLYLIGNKYAKYQLRKI